MQECAVGGTRVTYHCNYTKYFYTFFSFWKTFSKSLHPLQIPTRLSIIHLLLKALNTFYFLYEREWTPLTNLSCLWFSLKSLVVRESKTIYYILLLQPHTFYNIKPMIQVIPIKTIWRFGKKFSGKRPIVGRELSSDGSLI